MALLPSFIFEPKDVPLPLTKAFFFKTKSLIAGDVLKAVEI
jgi:hypothetical protein